ncbi:uncharacterized protein N7459_001562 [Penicillium hispanicum]|uniref:uncharacterized protein n=1 Tax=Penicillium hispanicum TaxID=1080232 RepID=UPI00253F95FF|nr:uncharacterized protein N7459_001562 [Penicillium hispanicum]KAJ5595354.1 hypothetical protein N7459_001562 [Penicillium hispanicum]
MTSVYDHKENYATFTETSEPRTYHYGCQSPTNMSSMQNGNPFHLRQWDSEFNRKG